MPSPRRAAKPDETAATGCRREHVAETILAFVDAQSPGGRNRNGRLVMRVGIDASGGMDKEIRREFLRGVSDACSAFKDHEIHVYGFGAKVAGCSVFTPRRPLDPERFSVATESGTSFQGLFDGIKQAMRISGVRQPFPLVVLTHGVGDAPAQPPWPVLWAIAGGDACTAACGTSVRIA